MGNVEPIVDTIVDKTEIYIKDLETEIDKLKTQNKSLALKLSLKPEQQDINCCSAYALVVKNFHRLLDDIIPF